MCICYILVWMVLELTQNLKKELQALLHEKEDINLAFTNMLTTSRPYHLQKWEFRSGIPIQNFNDLSFFKSAAWLEDYVGLSAVTWIAAEFPKKLELHSVCVWNMCRFYAFVGNMHVCMWWKCIWYCFQYTCFFISIQKLGFRLGYAYAECEFRLTRCSQYA